MPSVTERDYVLGTHDEEIARLGIQHAVWRDEVQACWRNAGIGPGAQSKGMNNIRFLEQDLARDALGLEGFDASWCRWVAAFVANPDQLVRTLAGALKRGGVAVFHEYADYASWRLAPRCVPVEEFVREVMAAWRESGGEPDIALELPRLLQHHGLRLRSARPIVWALRPADPGWRWLASFVDSGLRRLVDLKRVKPDWADRVRREFRQAEANPDSRMLTPLVLELVAEKA